MDGIDWVELERRLQLNEAKSDGMGGSAKDLGVRETLIFITTIVLTVLAALLWRQL